MKQLFYLLIILAIISACTSPEKSNLESSTDNKGSMENNYDSLAAQKFGADQYGMKKYVIAFLKKGPNRDLDSSKAAELQKAHLENIFKMADEGKLVVAGPFLEEGDLRGIYIFNVSSIEEAENLTNSDPAVQAGSLVMELKLWYGSAALVGINEVHKTLSKQSITDGH